MVLINQTTENYQQKKQNSNYLSAHLNRFAETNLIFFALKKCIILDASMTPIKLYFDHYLTIKIVRYSKVKTGFYQDLSSVIVLFYLIINNFITHLLLVTSFKHVKSIP